MSDFEEKLNILKKKKLTAKTIVEQQRKEIRIWKSSLTLNERLEEIFQRFLNRNKINEHLYQEILRKDKQNLSSSNKQIQYIIDDLSKLIEQILILLSINERLNIQNNELNLILKKQKDLFHLIKWKLSDIYAHRIADEVSCITS